MNRMKNIVRIYELFPEHSRKAIDSLVDDPSFQKQIPNLILNKLYANNVQVLPIDSEILPLFFTRAKFAEEEESYRISVLFGRYFSNPKDFLPLAVDHLKELEELKEKNRLTEERYHTKGEDFASRCLFSLSLFYGALEKLHSRGAPHPGFYREMGKRVFNRIGETSIAEHFENWEDFIKEEMFA